MMVLRPYHIATANSSHSRSGPSTNHRVQTTAALISLTVIMTVRRGRRSTRTPARGASSPGAAMASTVMPAMALLPVRVLAQMPKTSSSVQSPNMDRV